MAPASWAWCSLGVHHGNMWLVLTKTEVGASSQPLHVNKHHKPAGHDGMAAVFVMVKFGYYSK